MSKNVANSAVEIQDIDTTIRSNCYMNFKFKEPTTEVSFRKHCDRVEATMNSVFNDVMRAFLSLPEGKNGDRTKSLERVVRIHQRIDWGRVDKLLEAVRAGSILHQKATLEDLVVAMLDDSLKKYEKQYEIAD